METIEIKDVRGRLCRLNVIVVFETLIQARIQHCYKQRDKALQEVQYTQQRIKEAQATRELLESINKSDLATETKDKIAQAIWERYVNSALF